MIKCIKHRLINIFSFDDHAGRLDFFCVLAGISFAFFFGFLLFVEEGTNLDPIVGLPILGAYLFIICANISRRLNDLGKPSAYGLLILVPILQIVLIYYLILVSGKNKK